MIASGILTSAILICILRYDKNSALVVTLGIGLGLAAALQTFVGADFQINGAHTGPGLVPFQSGNMNAAARSELRPPDEQARNLLRTRLLNDQYRVALVCDASVAGGLCTGHVPTFWRLRTVDGYYGVGVPVRLAALPWGAAKGLRTISFTSVDQLEWPVLSFLNAKYALVVGKDLYFNAPPDPIERATVVSNLLAVVPRAFLVSRLEMVSDYRSAVVKIFHHYEPESLLEISFVEHYSGRTEFLRTGTLKLSGGGDRLQIDVSSLTADRFLVLNELYFPGWKATTDGKAVPIYPVNVVMRGGVIPANSKRVVFINAPFVTNGFAKLIHLLGIVLAALIWGLFSYVQRSQANARRGQ